MKQTTIEIIQNVLAADETVMLEELQKIIQFLTMANTVKPPRPGTITEAAKILSVHEATIRRYAKAGLLTPIRITARKVYYDLNEVETLATSGVGT